MKAVSTSLSLQIAQIDDMSFDDSSMLKQMIEESTFDDVTKVDLVVAISNRVVEISEAARGIHGPKGQTCTAFKDYTEWLRHQPHYRYIICSTNISDICNVLHTGHTTTVSHVP